jgi:hypothetical protein
MNSELTGGHETLWFHETPLRSQKESEAAAPKRFAADQPPGGQMSQRGPAGAAG